VRLPAVVACCCALAACGPSWKVVKQAEPNPFHGKARYELKLDLSQMRYAGKTKAEFAATAAEGKAGWEATEQALASGLVDSFQRTATREGLEVVTAGAPYQVKVIVGAIDPGHPWAGPSHTPITAQILLDDRVLEEVVLEHQTAGGSGNSSPDPRIHEDGEWLGAHVAKYVSTRVKAK